MTHPQNSPRGLFAKNRIDIGGVALTYDSTGNLLTDGGLALSEQTDIITQDASGVNFPGAISLSGQSALITQGASGVNFPSAISLSGETDLITQNSTGVLFPTAISLSGETDAITQNGTGVLFPTAISLSGQTGTITQSSTGVVLPTVSAIPSARAGNGTISIISDSTGRCIVINRTGTTWEYLSSTSVRPS